MYMVLSAYLLGLAAGWFWLRVSHNVAVPLPTNYSPLKAWPVLEDLLLRSLKSTQGACSLLNDLYSGMEPSVFLLDCIESRC